MCPCYDYDTDNHPLSPAPGTWPGHGVRVTWTRENTADWWSLWGQGRARPGRCMELRGWGSGARHVRRGQDKEGGDTVFRYLARRKDCCSSRKQSWAVCSSWGVSATTDLCWPQSPFPAHTEGWAGASRGSLQLYVCSESCFERESCPFTKTCSYCS